MKGTERVQTTMPQTGVETRSVKPYIALILGNIAISSSAIFVKLTDAPVGISAFYRLLFSVLAMSPWIAVYYWRELISLRAKDWLFAVCSGVFLAFHFILWFASLNYTSVASSVVLVALQPLFAFVGAYYFFKERTTLHALIGTAIAVGGSAIIGWGDFHVGGMALFGDALALLATALVTVYWLFGQQMRKTMSLAVYTFVVYAASTVTLFAYNFVEGASFTNYAAKDWWVFVGLAVFPTLLGHTVLNWSLKWVGAATVSVSILLEPIGAAVLAYYILDETLTTSQWIGGTLILIGVYAFMRTQAKKV